jgi:hypothetical protein
MKNKDIDVINKINNMLDENHDFLTEAQNDNQVLKTIKNQIQDIIKFTNNFINDEKHMLNNIEIITTYDNAELMIKNNINNLKQMLKKLDEIMKTINKS